MARTLLVRGMLVGAVAGVLAFLFGKLVGEGPIDAAIAFEYAHQAPGTDDPEIVSRTIQSTLGLGVAVLIYGSALGGIFGLLFAFAYGRLGRLGARPIALLVAIFGLVAVYLVPFLKYPANPPSVGEPDTIAHRSQLYFSMIVISVAAAIAAIVLGRRLLARFNVWDAVPIAVAGYVVVIVLAWLIMPTVSEVPAEFPATVLWRFRVASLGTQVVLWGTCGLLFGALTDRSLRRGAAAARPQPVPAG
ncbi:MAG TPA: CbtA family protein [Mycobacteriales bacterium]|nr:CbtA family protein [Mycobacteriales bacterium]